MCQPFPVFAIIGTRTASELRSSVEAAELELSAEEVAWLNLEESAESAEVRSTPAR